MTQFLQHLPCILPLLLNWVTPPASEAYNEEGEEEKEEEEEEEEEEPLRPAKCQRTAPASSKGKGKDKGKGKVRANTPATLETSERFPIPVRKTHGKNKKGELPAYVPPQPVPTMDTVTLAAETLANGQHEPTVDAPTASSATASVIMVPPRSFCEHCNKGCLSHCSHTFAVTDHSRATNHLEPYTRLSNECGNELITDLPLPVPITNLPANTSSVPAPVSQSRIPEALRPLWGQLLIDAEAELSVDYRAAVMRYLFISDPRRTDLPTDEDLPTLIEFPTHRAARACQPTPPPEEGLKLAG
ncbi:hypothetical protein B0H14DRAFT_2635296 [Mycena olivaceomarginata]|nr:hypothetical protein B0H14DRAFT_2635296 [Mycena olivaceomarginata]